MIAMVHRLLVVGSGTKEHTIVRALDRSPQDKTIYCFTSNMNPGIAKPCDKITVGNINDPEFVVHYAKETGATLAGEGKRHFLRLKENETVQVLQETPQAAEKRLTDVGEVPPKDRGG